MYRRVYETMPVQWLNAYGQAQSNQLSGKAVWAYMCKMLKSGAMWTSGYCAEEKERHGTAFNRFLQCLVAWVKYQEEPKVKSHNEALRAPLMCQQLYSEIAAAKTSVE